MKIRKATRQKTQNASARARKELNSQVKIMKKLAIDLKKQKTALEKKHGKPVAETYDAMANAAQQGARLLKKKVKKLS